ncbi:MAG TPA: hypothetical protein VE912_21995 [Bacteroidales bacterium]|nr:hypothetical protein [Bacteroidales bacterium]
MKRISTLIVIAILFTACASTKDVIPTETANSIPKGSTKVIVTSKFPADSLYKESFTELANEGYTVIHSSDQMHQISAKNTMDLLGGDELTVNILVNNKGNGSKAILSGTWNNSYLGTNKAEWSGGRSSKYEYSFAMIVKIAKRLNGTLSYSK